MLDTHSAAIEDDRNSRKQPLTDEQARQLLDSIEVVHVARGKKIREIDKADATVADLQGPTGNYRAPMIRFGGQLLVGLHLETLTGWLA